MATTSIPGATIVSLPDLQDDCNRLYLCRHGETESNAQRLLQGSGVDSPLNAKGHEQAEALARSLAGLPITTVASSTLVRAVATADLIAAQHSADRRRDAALGEMSCVCRSLEPQTSGF